MKFFKNQKGSSLIELIAVVAIISSLVAGVAPLYISSLENAKEVADEVTLNNAVTLASSMYVMKEAPAEIMYYSNDATLETSKNSIEAYGQTLEHEKSIVKVYFSDDHYEAEWVKAIK